MTVIKHGAWCLWIIGKQLGGLCVPKLSCTDMKAGFQREASFAHLFNSQWLTYFIFIPKGYATKSSLFKVTNSRSFYLKYLTQRYASQLTSHLCFGENWCYGVRIQHHLCLPEFSGRSGSNPEWCLFTFFKKENCICFLFKKWLGGEWEILIDFCSVPALWLNL